MLKAGTMTMISRPQRRMMLLTAAAALGSTTCDAFVPPRSPSSPLSPLVLTPRIAADNMGVHQTRLYSSSKGNGGGLLGGLKSVAKSVLPKRWTQSKEERTASLARKEQKNIVKNGIKEMLKDAPLVVRMVGSFVAPILSSLASTVQAQQQQTQDLLDNARDFILSDSAATAALGEPIVMQQQPFSQSSSSTSIDGQMVSRVQASFYVEGTRQQGVATMIASQGGIQNLSLQVDGQIMNIALVKSAGGGSSSNEFGASSSQSSSNSSSSKSTIGRNRINKDDIIDVEFVEKTVRKP